MTNPLTVILDSKKASEPEKPWHIASGGFRSRAGPDHLVFFKSFSGPTSYRRAEDMYGRNQRTGRPTPAPQFAKKRACRRNAGSFRPPRHGKRRGGEDMLCYFLFLGPRRSETLKGVPVILFFLCRCVEKKKSFLQGVGVEAYVDHRGAFEPLIISPAPSCDNEKDSRSLHTSLLFEHSRSDDGTSRGHGTHDALPLDPRRSKRRKQHIPRSFVELRAARAYSEHIGSFGGYLGSDRC